MKTVLISADDLLELKLLKERLEKEAYREGKRMDSLMVKFHGGGRYSEVERDARRAVEVIERILK